MKKLGTEIFTHDFGHKVCAVVMRDINSKRVSVELYIIYADGSMSDIITIARKDFYTKKNCLDFFFDMDGGFGRDDIDKIRLGVLDALNDESAKEEIQSKATLEELHQSISKYIKTAEELPDCGVKFIKEGYGYISSEVLEEFVKEHKELGYKRIEILKRLKIMGALQNGKGRAYDMVVNIHGLRKHLYKIELAEEVADEQEDEVIENEN